MTDSAPAAPYAILDERVQATIRRVGRLETNQHHRNSFIPYAPPSTPGRPFVQVDGEELLMMSGYSYLGLNGDPRVIAAAQRAAAEFGTGAHGVRALAGSMPIHTELGHV